MDKSGDYVCGSAEGTLVACVKTRNVPCMIDLSEVFTDIGVLEFTTDEKKLFNGKSKKAISVKKNEILPFFGRTIKPSSRLLNLLNLCKDEL